MHRPLSLKRRNAAVLCSTWSDGLESCVLMSDLRDACPCAHCSGEQIMGQVVFPGMKTLAPGMNDLKALTPVGNYGIQAAWKDGHDTGIYSFDMLRSIFVSKRLSKETLEQIDAQLEGTSR